MMRGITVNNKNELESTVDKYVMNGYELVFMNNQEALVRKKRWTAGWIIGIALGLLFFLIIGIILLVVRAVMDVDSVQITVAKYNTSNNTNYNANDNNINNINNNANGNNINNNINNNNNPKDDSILNNDLKTKFCTNCGVKIPEDSDFCPKCGANLQEPEMDNKESSDLK